MKKQTIICGLAVAAAATLAYASSDKIRFVKDGEPLRSISVDKIKGISYSGDAGRIDKMEISLVDGSARSVKLDDFDHIEYVQPLPANPLSVDVEPHHLCATLTVTSPDPSLHYRISGMPESYLVNYDEEEWADKIIEADIRYIESVAEFYGRPLSSFSLETIFEHGSRTRDWFPDDDILPGTPIALVAYTTRLEGEDVVVTTEPLMIRFVTKEYEILDVDFDISADLSSNSINLKVDAVDSDIPFAIALYSAEDVKNKGMSDLIKSSIGNMEIQVYNYGSTWDEVTFRNHGEKSFKNLRVGDEYVAVAFGCEYGVCTTRETLQNFVVPEPVITDPCTFDINTEKITNAEMCFKITPSNPETRYAAFLVNSDQLKTTPSKYISGQIYWYNINNTVQWNDSKFIFTGESELSTHDDMLGGMYLVTGTEYKVLVCGIDESGTRTTDIKEVTFTPSGEVSEALAFDVQFGELEKSSGSYRFLEVNVTPSDPDARYVFTKLPASNAYADLSYDDEEFIERYVSVEGKYLELVSGPQTKKFSFSSEWDYTASGYIFGKYICMIFGYDGAPTSPLYAFEIDAETGEVRQLRGPDMQTLF